MTTTEEKDHRQFILPARVVSKADLTRLINELERVDNELTSISVHAKAGQAATENPGLSQSLLAFLTENGLQLGDTNQRARLIAEMRLLKDTVPIVHMTFASEVEYENLQKIVAWFRGSIHPQAVVSASLQPGLIAGVYLRTPNRIFDMSLRARLDSHRDELASAIGALHASR